MERKEDPVCEDERANRHPTPVRASRKVQVSDAQQRPSATTLGFNTSAAVPEVRSTGPTASRAVQEAMAKVRPKAFEATTSMGTMGATTKNGTSAQQVRPGMPQNKGKSAIIDAGSQGCAVVKARGVPTTRKHATNKSDGIATQASRDFDVEVHTWKSKGGLSDPAPRRAKFADYLTDKYLCQRLDPLESSAVVSRYRRRIVRRIEDISEGLDPEETEAMETTVQGVQGQQPEVGLSVHRQQQQQIMDERRKASSLWLKPVTPTTKKTESVAVSGDSWTCALCYKKNIGIDACHVCGRSRAWKSQVRHGGKEDMKTDNQESTDEKEKFVRDHVQHDYQNFMRSKRCLQGKAGERNALADEIRGVLSGLSFSDSPMVPLTSSAAATNKNGKKKRSSIQHV